MTGNQTRAGTTGLAEFDDGLVYTLGAAVYELTTGELGWLVRGATGTGRRTERCFGDLLLAERVFFRTVADAIITHRPYTCEARIGDVHLVLTRVDTAWHLGESSATPLAAAFSDELSGRCAWRERADELIRGVAGASSAVGPSVSRR